MELVSFNGGVGSGYLCPPPPDPRMASLIGHIVSATRRSMALTPLMQLELGYYATGAYFLVIGDTLGLSKDATSRVENRVSKALCAMGRGLVLFPTSDVNGVFYNSAGPYKIPNYQNALSHTVCGDHKQTDVVFF